MGNEIKTLEDLRSHLWEMLGYVDMMTVDEVLDLVKRHRRLLKDHIPPATENPRHGSICWSCGAEPGDLHDPQCGYRTWDPNGRQPVRIPPVKEQP